MAASTQLITDVSGLSFASQSYSNAAGAGTAGATNLMDLDGMQNLALLHLQEAFTILTAIHAILDSGDTSKTTIANDLLSLS